MARVMVEMKTSSDLANLAQIRAFICENTPADRVSEVERAEIVLAVQEAACNIMVHAYKRERERPIWVQVDVSHEQMHIRLYHIGETFNPDQAQQPAFDGSQEGGFGLFIMSQCMADVSYFQDGTGRNGVSLKKRFNGGFSNACTA